MQAFRFKSLSGVHHAISTRHGGVSEPPYDSLNVGYGTPDDEHRVRTNRLTFFRSANVDPEHVVAARLTHGAEVSVFRRSNPDAFPITPLAVRSASCHTEPFFSTDGAVSDVPGLYLFLTFADCVPLLFFDRVKGVMGVAHAGWRGTAAGIGGHVVRTMATVFGSKPKDIVGGIGPSIGPCCYVVDTHVTEIFDTFGNRPVVDERTGRIFLDLWETNKLQMRETGVETIECQEVCTSCSVDTYFSHRAEAGKTGRFGMVAGLPVQ